MAVVPSRGIAVCASKPICLENTCPTHGLTVFNGKVKNYFWNKQRKSWKNANEKHCVRTQRTLHRLTPSITSYIHTKTTTDFFSTTDWTDGTDFIKADLHFLFLNTNHSNVTNLFFALRAEIHWKSFWKSLEPDGSEKNTKKNKRNELS